jgi:hypothetical protein
MRFTLHDNGGTVDGGIYFAENDGCCRFFSHHGSNNNGGFGGRRFDITMVDGTPKTLHGPWSSNMGEVNDRGFGPCIEVCWTTDHAAYVQGNTSSGAITLSKLREASDRIDVGLGYTWRPGAPYASEIAFPTGSKFALACSGHVRIDHKDGRDHKLVVRPEVFADGTLIENIRAALFTAFALDDSYFAWRARVERITGSTSSKPPRTHGHDLAYEIGQRYQRHVPYDPVDSLLALSSYEAAVQFPDGEYWVKPATL